jgi:hypothetical protein
MRLNALADQHEALDVALHAAWDALAALADPAGNFTADRARAADALSAMAEFLAAHLTLEEQTALPLTESEMPAAEYGKLETKARKATPRAQARFMIPWVIAHSTADQRKALYRSAPPPASSTGSTGAATATWTRRSFAGPGRSRSPRTRLQPGQCLAQRVQAHGAQAERLGTELFETEGGPGAQFIGDLTLSVNGNLVTYQPADRFWPFQFIEAGIFVALTAAALGTTIWLLHRRATWTA